MPCVAEACRYCNPPCGSPLSLAWGLPASCSTMGGERRLRMPVPEGPLDLMFMPVVRLAPPPPAPTHPGPPYKYLFLALASSRASLKERCTSSEMEGLCRSWPDRMYIVLTLRHTGARPSRQAEFIESDSHLNRPTIRVSSITDLLQCLRQGKPNSDVKSSESGSHHEPLSVHKREREIHPHRLSPRPCWPGATPAAAAAALAQY